MYGWGRGAVAKVPDLGTPEDWIYCEARYTAAVRDAGAPAPRLLGIEQVNGRAASIYERVHGPSMWQYVVDRPDRAVHYGQVLADLHGALFDLVPPVSLPSQRDRLTCKIRRAAREVDASLADALDLLTDRPDPPRLCHGDFHPGNVILAPDGPMIVDWFDACRGDACADVARSSLLLLDDGLSAPQHLPGADRMTLVALAEAYMARIMHRFPVPADVLERWQAIEAVARLAEGVAQPQLLRVWQRKDRSTHLSAVPTLPDGSRLRAWLGQDTGS